MGDIAYKQLYLPKRTYGPPEKFFADGLKLNLPSDKEVIWTPLMNDPNQKYIDSGAMIALNPGDTFANVPYQSRGVFMNNAEYLRGPNMGNPIANWQDRQPARNAINSFITAKGGAPRIFTSGAQEANESVQFYPWRQSINEYPVQYRWIEEEVSAAIGALGGENYGPYDGHINLLGSTEDLNNINILRSAFIDPNQALTLAKAATGFGNPYFTQEFYKIPYRHALINTYYAGSMNPYKRLIYMICMYIVHRMAEKATGVAKKLLSFEFSGKSEFYGDNMLYNYVMGNGAIMQTNDFPLHSFKYQVAKGLLDFLYVDRRFCWQDTYRYGDNKSIVGTEEDGFHLVGQSTGLTRLKRTTVYRVEGAPYVPSPQGFSEANLQGTRWYGLAASHTATQFWQYCKFRDASGNKGFNDNTDHTYILNNFVNNDANAWLMGSLNASNQALLVWPGETDKTLEFNINRSSSLILDIPANVPSVFLIS